MSTIMAAKTPVSILSMSALKKSISSQSKKHGVVSVKSTVANPFILEFPEVNDSNEEIIVSLIKESFRGMQRIVHKPRWSDLVKLKRADRRAFVDEFQRKALAASDENEQSFMRQKEKDWSHLVLGFNAVMRALEKGKLCAILVKRNVTPEFLVKTFLPGCANLEVPLVAVKDLDLVLNDTQTLGITHSCIVLGVKKSAETEGNRFNILYRKMCEVLEMEVNVRTVIEADTAVDAEMQEESDDETKSEINADETEEFRKLPEKYVRLTDEQIEHFYVRRTDSMTRAFTPGDPATLVDKDQSSDFISLGNVISLDIGPMSENKKRKLNGIEKTSRKKRIPFISNTTNLSSFMTIDSKGYSDCHQVQADSNVNIEMKMNRKQSQKRDVKVKQPTVRYHSYIPAQLEKSKVNPDKKKKKKKK